jgi:hypothetical protein
MLANVTHEWNQGTLLLKKMLADINGDTICEQPTNLPNHPLWTIGHLALVRAHISKMGPKPVAFPEAWAPLFGRGSTPTNDKSFYPAMNAILASFDEAHAGAVETLESLSPEQLAGPHSMANFKASHPTLGDLLVRLTIAHDGLHAGQLSDWRRAMKLPRVI